MAAAMSERAKRPEAAEPSEPQWRGPSRSQKKRDARAVADLGAVLVGLKRAQLDKVPLEEDLRDAVLACQTMKRGAYARQLRFIAQQLNGSDDLEPIKKALRELGKLE